MGFRNEFFRPARLPDRVRHKAGAMIWSSSRGEWNERTRASEFPRFALQLALLS